MLTTEKIHALKAEFTCRRYSMHDTFEDFNYRGFAKAIEREAYELAAYQCDLVVERARLIELMQHMDCAASLARTIRALINEPSKERNIQ